jgi:hypothetical protein
MKPTPGGNICVAKIPIAAATALVMRVKKSVRPPILPISEVSLSPEIELGKANRSNGRTVNLRSLINASPKGFKTSILSFRIRPKTNARTMEIPIL